MHNEILGAGQAVDGQPAVRDSRWYPLWHLAPPRGWMNDPNGLIWYQGVLHAFYQHHPFDPNWGPMHWGHARSSDMLHWEHLPIALAPGTEDDLHGCFSGSAVENQGELALLYTGHRWLGAKGDDSQLKQVQCLATSSDGLHFQKQGKVLSPSGDTRDFRDPKVWRQDDRWFMVVGARSGDRGQVRLYSSHDLRNWRDDGVLLEAEAGMGYMWECPDFFPLGDKYVLMFSPQGIVSHGLKYRNIFQSGCIVGDWKPGSAFRVTCEFVELDLGHDFYAPQSFTTSDGRRVVIGWMDMWGAPMPSKQDGWAGCFSMPRELSLDPGGNVRQRPIREISGLRSAEPTVLLPQKLEEGALVLEEECNALELELIFDPAGSNAEKFGIRLGNASGTETGFSLWVDNQVKRLILDRHYPEHHLCGYRSAALPKDGILVLRLFFDRSSVEVFVNDGEIVMSTRIYPGEGQRHLALFSYHGTANLQGAKLWKY